MEQIFLKVLNMSITAGYCTLAVLVLRLLLKKFPKVYSYALWSIVAFRLLCPVSFESVFSLMRISPNAVPQDIALQQTPQISTGLKSIDTVVNKALAVTAPTTALSGTSPLNGPDSANPLQIILFFGSIVWILVAVFLFSYSVITYVLTRQRLKGARQEAPGIYVSDCLKTPFVLGLFKPVIYLPEGLTGNERDYVLLHEQTHIRRYDHLIKLAAFVLVCLHWFNPLLWLAYFLMCADMEMSCDETVVRTLAGEHATKTKKEYASTLLGLASHHPVSFGGPLAFGEGNIRQRITNVLTYKKRTVFVSALLVVAVAAAILLLAGDQKEPSQKQPDSTETPKNVSVTPEVITTPDSVTTYDTSGMTFLGEDGTVRYYYGVVTEALTETGYFTLEIFNELCLNEISYLLALEKQPDGEYAVLDINFYTIEQVNSEKFTKEHLMAIIAKKPYYNSSFFQELEEYHWFTLKDYQKDLQLEQEGFIITTIVALVNEQGTGGYNLYFPLDNPLEPGTDSYQHYATFGDAFTQNGYLLTIHRMPAAIYTDAELKEYADAVASLLDIKKSMEQGENDSEDILVYIKEINLENLLVTFDSLEWVMVPSERADELGYTLDDAPNGFILLHDAVELRQLPLAEDCTFHLLDWEHSYQNTTVTRSEFLRTFTERGQLFDSLEYPPYHILVENGEILDIQEQYIP